MAKTILDLTGSKGLTTKFQGDLHDTSPQPHLRYLGEDGQMASGIYNPFKKNGYLTPANNTYSTITGTIAGSIVASVYDSVNDVAYFADNALDPSLLSLDGLDDTSLTQVYGLSSLDSLTDLELYQLNGKRILLFAGVFGQNYKGHTVGILPLDDGSGPALLDSKVIESGVSLVDEVVNVSGVTRLAQRFGGEDVSSQIKKIRLRLGAGGTQSYTITVAIQADSAGVPSGTDLVTAAAPSSLLKSINVRGGDVYFTFPSTLSVFSGTYWIVLTANAASDSLFWYRTSSDKTLYAAGAVFQFDGSWSLINANESFDFSILTGRTSTWWSDDAGVTDLFPDESLTSFLQKADNGFCYWFTGHRVHKLDGGLSGGGRGTIVSDILLFPEYLSCVDAIDINSNMYIAIQSSPIQGAAVNRSYLADVAGVYIWDRQSTVLGTRNYITLPGIREIRKIFQTRDGVIKVITINNDRMVEIWGLSNSNFVLLDQLGVGAYPVFRDSVTMLNGFVIWSAYDGRTYAYGKVSAGDKDRVFIIGNQTTQTANAFTSGVLLTGNEVASGQQQAVFMSWIDNITGKLSKWYPHGTGTIDSNVQRPDQGDIFTLVQQVPSMTTIDRIRIIMLPYAGSGTTAVANIKIFFNQSTTAWATKPVTANDIAKGYMEIPIRQSNVNSYQLEVEYVTTTTLGTSEFNPIYAEVTYQTEKRQP